MNAILPLHLEDTALIKLLPPGATAYTVPWAMWVDHDRNCWLHPQYQVRQSPGGTAGMRVEHRSDGYYVTPPTGCTWTLEEPGFSGAADTKFIPVAGLLFPNPTPKGAPHV